MRQRFSFQHSISVILIPALAALFVSPISYSEDLVSSPNAPAIYDEQVTPVVCRQCGSRECECELMCCPQKVIETEKKSFWKVTCEYVCIAGFRFPWECKKNQCGCECLVCGTVRAVNILEKEEHECETCGYKWEVKCVRSSGEAWRSDCSCPRCAEQERTRLATREQPEKK